MFFFNFLVEHASLRSHSFLKPHPYVELIIDGNPARKTEIQKNTYLPKWNDTFTVLVTPTSILQFRIYDHSNFRKDSLMGEQTVYLSQLLQNYNGKCENLELVMDILYESKSEARQLKNGELVAVLNGLTVDVATIPNSSNGSTSYLDAVQNGSAIRSSVLNGGIRSRMRLRSSTSSSTNGSVVHVNGNASACEVQSPASTGAVRRNQNQNLNWDQPPPPSHINSHHRIVPSYSNPMEQQPPQQPMSPPLQPMQTDSQPPSTVSVPNVSANGVPPTQPAGGPPPAADDDEPLPQGWERR